MTSPAVRPLDDMDHRILALLVEDGRASMQSIADRIGLRRPSVHARMKRLESEGYISAYRAILDPGLAGRPLLAFVSLRIGHGKGVDCLSSCGRVADAARAIPEVVEVHTVSGEDDMMLKVRVASIEELERVVMKRISGIPQVERVRTTIALSTQLERGLTASPPRRKPLAVADVR